MKRKTIVLVGICVLMVLVLFTACSGTDVNPTPTLSAEPSPSATPVPTPVPTPTPEPTLEDIEQQLWAKAREIKQHLDKYEEDYEPEKWDWIYAYEEGHIYNYLCMAPNVPIEIKAGVEGFNANDMGNIGSAFARCWDIEAKLGITHSPLEILFADEENRVTFIKIREWAVLTHKGDKSEEALAAAKELLQMGADLYGSLYRTYSKGENYYDQMLISDALLEPFMNLRDHYAHWSAVTIEFDGKNLRANYKDIDTLILTGNSVSSGTYFSFSYPGFLTCDYFQSEVAAYNKAEQVA